EIVAIGKRYVQLEEKTIELRLRQRIRSLHLEGILGGQHDERLVEDVRALADGDAMLLHGLQERALSLRGRAVDLVGEHDVGKNRPSAKFERPRSVRPLF